MKPASHDIASRLALLCLAQLPANMLVEVMIKAKMVVKIIFIVSPFLMLVVGIFETKCLKFKIDYCVEMTRFK